MQSRPNKLQEYSSKAILSKIPSDFIGIAKEYTSAKRHRMMSQQLFDSYQHEVSSIAKINNSLAKSLTKKKKELKYVQAVRSRYMHESMQKQKLHQLKELELSKLRHRTLEEKNSLENKLAQVREKLMFRKKTECETTKKQLNHYKSQRLMEESRIYSRNQSRVQEIEEEKARIKDYYNRFFQNKNRKFMQNYKEMINAEKSREQNYKSEMKNMEIKLLMIKEDTKKKQQLLAQLNSSIESLKESRQSFRSSRHGSTRSMTPMEILSGSLENPQKPRLKLVQKD